MQNDTKTNEETPTTPAQSVDYEHFRQIVREEIDTALQDVLPKDEVKAMIEQSITDVRRETKRLVDGLRTEREEKTAEDSARLQQMIVETREQILSGVRDQVQGIRDQITGFVEMHRMANKKVDSLAETVAAWQSSHEKRIATVTDHVQRLDDRVDRIEPVVDQVKAINETISKLDGKVETVVHFAEWRMKEVEKWENRWQTYIWPFIRWGLTLLLGSGAGLGGYELIK